MYVILQCFQYNSILITAIFVTIVLLFAGATVPANYCHPFDDMSIAYLQLRWDHLIRTPSYHRSLGLPRGRITSTLMYVFLLSSVLRAWPNHLGCCILMKEVMLSSYDSLQRHILLYYSPCLQYTESLRKYSYTGIFDKKINDNKHLSVKHPLLSYIVKF